VLGLEAVHGMIGRQDGWIEASSKAGNGGKLPDFPKNHDMPPEHDTRTAPPKPGTRPSETLLLVEDETALRALVSLILNVEGYRVIEAPNGAAALEKWKLCRDDVALLLTDIVMPEGVNGRQLAEMLQKDKPTLKVLFMSGYSETVFGDTKVLKPGVNFLQKPFLPTDLLLTIRRSLDAPG
jgi:two-component system cell cycle sensor histidine kinase/response regulator CckA